MGAYYYIYLDPFFKGKFGLRKHFRFRDRGEGGGCQLPFGLRSRKGDTLEKMGQATFLESFPFL